MIHCGESALWGKSVRVCVLVGRCWSLYNRCFFDGKYRLHDGWLSTSVPRAIGPSLVKRRMQTAINGLPLSFRIVGLTLKSLKIGNFWYKFIEGANPLNIFFKFAIGSPPLPHTNSVQNMCVLVGGCGAKIHTYK